MSSFTDKERFDYYWKHFALIADQRVKTFNFYIIVLLASFGATISAFKLELPRHLYCLIGVGQVFVVIVFWIIESRGKAIVKVAREALQEFEQSDAFGEGHRPMTEENLKGTRGKYGLVTYGFAFRLVFVAHLVFGLMIAARPSWFVPEPSSKNLPASLARAK